MKKGPMVCANPITLICPVMPTVAYSITKMEIPHAVGQGPQIREQILVPDLYVLTVESAAYKKRLKREKKGHSPQPKIDFPYYEISDICSLICVSFPPVCAI